MKQFAKPVKEKLHCRITKSIPKKKIVFNKPAKKPVIKKIC